MASAARWSLPPTQAPLVAGAHSTAVCFALSQCIAHMQDIPSTHQRRTPSDLSPCVTFDSANSRGPAEGNAG